MAVYAVNSDGERMWLERDGEPVELPGELTRLHLAAETGAGTGRFRHIEATIRIDLADGETVAFLGEVR